ncbi:MAG: hypothetical protein ABIS36_15485 [Chryseolinea sp.]
MKVGRRISSFDAVQAVTETFHTRRLNFKDSKSRSLKSRLRSAKNDKTRAIQIDRAYQESLDYKYNPLDDEELIEINERVDNSGFATSENDDHVNKIILKVDSVEYQSGKGRSIQIKTRPLPDGVDLYVMITADTGLIEKGLAKQSSDERTGWVYKTKIRRPALFDMAICLWVLNDVDVLSEIISVG